MTNKYLIVTPVRDEENFVSKTILSVVNQTILPTKWIFVDDNSKDGTLSILKENEKLYKFICVKEVGQNTQRIPGIGVMKAFEFGLTGEDLSAYDFVVKIDADLEFESDFFENIFVAFGKNKKLGIASGLIIEQNGVPVSRNFDSHTYGGTKIYLRQCFQEILPIEKIKFWDLIDNIKANIKGYETKIIHSEKVKHLKPMDSAAGSLNEAKLKGRYCSYLGYDKTFFLMKAVKLFFEWPFFIKGAYHLLGYIENALVRKEFYANYDVVVFLQKQQKMRIKNMIKRFFP